MRRNATPRAVAWLGYGGLLPFVVPAALMWAVPGWQSWLHPALLDYGAVILSFVGALHWGRAMALPEQPGTPAGGMYAWSVVPSLLAWLALLVDARWAGTLLVAGFAAHWVQDLRLSRRVELPRWYLGLRTRLSLLACASLIAAQAATQLGR